MFNDEKGMATVDLIFATLIAIIIFGIFIASVDSSLDKTNMSDFGHMRLVGEKVVSAINTAYTNGNGYSVNVTITNIENAPYTINVNSNGLVTVKYGTNSVTLESIPKSNIETKTLNSGNTYIVNNTNGNIKISP